MQTKAVTITEEEIEALIAHQAQKLTIFSAIRINNTETIERINYLNKRLKAFKEPEVEVVKSNNSTAGWGSNDQET